MRGQVDPQGQMFSYFSPESRVPADHPLRSIKAHTDRVLFGWMKSWGGLRRTRFRGVARVQLHAHLVGAACNLLRLSRLRPHPV